MRLKQLIVQEARRLGWDAEAEVSGSDWRADVLAKRGKVAIAIEVQWSSQLDEETMRRQRRYEVAGIRCLWLFRQEQFPVHPSLPTARIQQDEKHGFIVSIGSGLEIKQFSLAEFLEHALSKRFQFGIPSGHIASVIVDWSKLHCWRCGAETAIVVGISFKFGIYFQTFRIGDFDRYEELARFVFDKIPTEIGIGQFKRRSSRIYRSPYLTNSCRHCGEVFSEVDLEKTSVNLKSGIEFQVVVTERWRAFVMNMDTESATWRVHPQVQV
jgi:hypothetical protein